MPLSLKILEFTSQRLSIILVAVIESAGVILNLGRRHMTTWLFLFRFIPSKGKNGNKTATNRQQIGWATKKDLTETG